MNDGSIQIFLAGAFTIASLAVALFFLQFWRKSGDRLFALLAWAFSLLALERAVLSFVPAEQEGRHWIYLARLIAFALIILGILQKNGDRAER